MSNTAIRVRSRAKPGTLARRLGCVLRALAYGVIAISVGAYLLIFISPVPAPAAEPAPEIEGAAAVEIPAILLSESSDEPMEVAQ